MVLTVTEPAQEKILELRAQEDEPDTLGLRIEVTGVRGPEYTYDLTFDPVADADVEAGDVIEKQGDLAVIIPADSTDSLQGATLDLPSTTGGGCQGCAVSAMTLREGIARSIQETIPEVKEVVDVTDHALGENPFYA